MNKTPRSGVLLFLGWKIFGLGLARARDYESATNRPTEPESPINRGFQPSPTLARPVLSRKFDQGSHLKPFTYTCLSR
jgi:hypothetical protein